MARGVEVVKTVRVDGKLYTDPLYAAKRWVRDRARNIGFKPACADRSDHTRMRRAWCFYRANHMPKQSNRYVQMVLPIFTKMLAS